MQVPIRQSSCAPTQGVGFDITDMGDWTDLAGGLVEKGLETGVNVGLQYGLAQLTGTQPGAPVGYAQPAPRAAAVAPIQTQTAPAAQAANTNTLLMVGAVAVIAIVLMR